MASDLPDGSRSYRRANSARLFVFLAAAIALLAAGVVAGIAYERAARARSKAAWEPALKEAREFIRATPGYVDVATVLDPIVDRHLDEFRHGGLTAPRDQRERDAVKPTVALFLMDDVEATRDPKAIEVANRLLKRVHLNSYWKDPLEPDSSQDANR